MLATKFLLRELFAFLLRRLLTLLDLLGVLLRFLFGLILQLVEVAGHGPSIPPAAAPAAPVRPGAYPPLEERPLCGPPLAATRPRSAQGLLPGARCGRRFLQRTANASHRCIRGSHLRSASKQRIGSSIGARRRPQGAAMESGAVAATLARRPASHAIRSLARL